MLNEILEFEAYVKSPESEKPRIQPKLLTNNFNEDGNLFGIERILIVIVKWAIENIRDIEVETETIRDRIRNEIESLDKIYSV